MLGDGVTVGGAPNVLEALLASLAMHVRAGLAVAGVYDLAAEGLAEIRASLGLADVRVSPLAGVFWGEPRGWIVVHLRMLTEAAVGALARNRRALRRFGTGVALLAEALRWYDDLVDESGRRYAEGLR